MFGDIYQELFYLYLKIEMTKLTSAVMFKSKYWSMRLSYIGVWLFL